MSELSSDQRGIRLTSVRGQLIERLEIDLSLLSVARESAKDREEEIGRFRALHDFVVAGPVEVLLAPSIIDHTTHEPGSWREAVERPDLVAKTETGRAVTEARMEELGIPRNPHAPRS